MKPTQLPLDISHENAYAEEDFQVSDCNRDAAAWVSKWPEWPFVVLTLYGAESCGKTHLGRVWQKKAAAARIENLPEIDDAVLRAENVFIDDVQRFIGVREAEEKLFHLFNALKQKGAKLLLTSAEPPQHWKCVVPDLHSRLNAGHAVGMQPPDDALMEMVLTKHFSDRQVVVSADVVRYVLRRVGRSFSALLDVAERLDREAFAQKRAITVPMARELLTDFS